MIIGAKWEQIPLLEAAKKSGHFVLATDSDQHADGMSLADAQEQLDPRDLSGALDLARKYKITGVTSDQCDYSRYAALFVGACLGFRDGNLAAAQSTTNKHWMRERCRQNQVLQPRFFACHTIEEVHAAIEIIGFPAIIKPVDNRGSIGVHKVDDINGVQEAFLDALMNAHSREVLVETYIEGTHITVDGCVDQSGKHHNLAIASKTVTSGSKPIITEVFYPAKIADDIRNHVLATNSKVIDTLGIDSGLTHAEYIVDRRGRCFLVEAANRGGGVLTSSKIVPLISGVDTSGLLIANAAGAEFFVRPTFKSAVVILAFFVFEPGWAAEISGVNLVEKMPGVLHFRLLVEQGRMLTSPQSGAQRHGFAILAGDTEKEVRELYKRAAATIKVRYEKRSGATRDIS